MVVVALLSMAPNASALDGAETGGACATDSKSFVTELSLVVVGKDEARIYLEMI